MASLGKNMSIQLESEFLPQKRRFLSNGMMRIRNVEKESHDVVVGIVSHLPPPPPPKKKMYSSPNCQYWGCDIIWNRVFAVLLESPLESKEI